MIVTREAIIAFAQAYDPQPIHLDEVAAEASIVGGLCASGFHTCAIMMRLLCDHWLLKTASLGAPGLDSVKWLKPVRPGDVLRLAISLGDKRVLDSRPDVGLVHARYELLNQNNEAVLDAACPQLVRLRSPGPGDSLAPRGPRAAQPKPLDLWSLAESHPPATDSLYFEDRRVGELLLLGRHTFASEEIVDFARQFDPQPFHLDAEAGRLSLFGGLAASGWHTAAQQIRLVVAERQRAEASLRARGLPVAQYGPSPGIENLKWLKPVLAGDTIEYRTMLAEKIDLKSRPTHGLIKSRTQGRNQRGDLVYEMTGMILAERRRATTAG